jgi:hypothetical protein
METVKVRINGDIKTLRFYRVHLGWFEYHEYGLDRSGRSCFVSIHKLPFDPASGAPFDCRTSGNHYQSV